MPSTNWKNLHQECQNLMVHMQPSMFEDPVGIVIVVCFFGAFIVVGAYLIYHNYRKDLTVTILGGCSLLVGIGVGGFMLSVVIPDPITVAHVVSLEDCGTMIDGENYMIEGNEKTNFIITPEGLQEQEFLKFVYYEEDDAGNYYGGPIPYRVTFYVPKHVYDVVLQDSDMVQFIVIGEEAVGVIKDDQSYLLY